MNRLAPVLTALVLMIRIDPIPAHAEPKEVDDASGQVRLATGDEDAAGLVDWAIARFEAAGLGLPPIEVRVHDDRAECAGHLGLTYDTSPRARVHLCTPGNGRGVLDRITLVHELAHAWVTENVGAPQRERFMAVHGLETWEGAQANWARLGVEWAAETVSWGVHDEGVRMIGEIDEDPAAARRGYAILTGRNRDADGVHRSAADRAADLATDREPRRLHLDDEVVVEPLTLDDLAHRWERARSRQGLPVGLPDWVRRAGSVVVTADLTERVELVVVTDGDRGVLAVTVNGGKDSVYERLDTVSAWGLLLAALQPDRASEVDAGHYDDVLVDHDGLLRGIVHLPPRPG